MIRFKSLIISLQSIYYHCFIIKISFRLIKFQLRNSFLISRFVEDPNESNTNVIKDDEKKKLQDDSNHSENYNQKGKKKNEQNKLNGHALDFNFQYEIEISLDEKIAFVQYAISARGGNII